MMIYHKYVHRAIISNKNSAKYYKFSSNVLEHLDRSWNSILVPSSFPTAANKKKQNKEQGYSSVQSI